MLVKESAPRDRRLRLGMFGLGTACLLGGLALGGRAYLSRPIDGAAPDDEIHRHVSAYHEAEANGFELPSDSGGKLLAQLLPPRGTLAAEAEAVNRPRPFPAPRSVALPVEPLPLGPGDNPSLPRPRKKDLQPQLVLDELLEDMEDPILPETVTFPAGARLALEEGSAYFLTELPPLAVAVPDRVPVEDVTAEASTAAALAASMPERHTLAPFLRLTVPDPYEHRRALEPPTLEEDPEPHTASPQTPGR